MKKIKIFLISIIMGAVCLTGCSIFDTVDSQDTVAILDALNDTEDTSNVEEQVTDEITTEEITTVPDFTVAVDETEDFTETSKEYQLGEKASVAFKTEAMSTAVIVPITLERIIRGNEAETIINSYNEIHPDNPICMLSDTELEFCVADYTLDLTEAEGIPETSTSIDAQILGNDLDNSVEFNNKSYSNFPVLYNDEGITISSGAQAGGQIFFVLPKDCENYKISFGDSSIQSVIFSPY